MIINYGNLVAFGNQTWANCSSWEIPERNGGRGHGPGDIWEDKGFLADNCLTFSGGDDLGG